MAPALGSRSDTGNNRYMQIWVIAVIVVAVIVVAFGGALLYRVLAERRLKRSVVWLIQRKEAIQAGSDSMRRLVTRMAEESDAQLARFAEDPECEDRRAFGDVALHMRIVDEELDHADVPAELFQVAVDMQLAARTIWASAEKAEARGGADALAGVASIDLRGITDHVGKMSAELHEFAARHHVDDHSVYGGGLYI